MIDKRIQHNHPLNKYGTFQIGGPADAFVEVQSAGELLEAVQWAEARDMPYFVFGGGSNLLFDDAGFRGLVIRNRAQGLEVDGHCLVAESGVMSSVLVNEAWKQSLTGLEKWNGLPGTVGGAVYGNAGCFGLETKDVLQDAEVYFPGEGVKTLNVEELEYGYRDSLLKRKPGVVLRARFCLKTGDADSIREDMQAITRSRAAKQPPGLNTGSFFKNPSPDQPAGKLIDECGLKGLRVGGMEVSEAHANFFMNKGGATSADVLELQERVTDTVQRKFGITLEREIIYVNESIPASA